MRMKRRGVEMRLEIIDGDAAPGAASIYRCSTQPPVRIDGPTICWRAEHGQWRHREAENIFRAVTCGACNAAGVSGAQARQGKRPKAASLRTLPP